MTWGIIGNCQIINVIWQSVEYSTVKELTRTFDRRRDFRKKNKKQKNTFNFQYFFWFYPFRRILTLEFPPKCSSAWALEKKWLHKYTLLYTQHERLIYNSFINGSDIWLWAQACGEIVRQNSFWEIKDGHTKSLWKDSWQQLPQLHEKLNLRDLQSITTSLGVVHVSEY